MLRKEIITFSRVCKKHCEYAKKKNAGNVHILFSSAKELSCAALWPTRRGWYSDQHRRIPFGLKRGFFSVSMCFINSCYLVFTSRTLIIQFIN
jgi:hypothetical protein